MSEQNYNDTDNPAGDRQDPAETSQLDTAVETETQPTTPEEVDASDEDADAKSEGELTHGGEMIVDSTGEVTEPTPEGKLIGGKYYAETDNGYRLQHG